MAVATVAWASSPHFISATGTLDGAGDYVASWKEAGLGNGPITYTLTAGQGTQFTYQCYTKSNNAPQGSPNNVFPSQLMASGTFPPSKNGQITASLTLEPQPDNDCQGGGLKLCLVAVSYQNMELADISTPAGPVSLPNRSATFINSANGRPTNCE
jgi:hypothetical protein